MSSTAKNGEERRQVSKKVNIPLLIRNKYTKEHTYVFPRYDLKKIEGTFAVYSSPHLFPFISTLHPISISFHIWGRYIRGEQVASFLWTGS